MTKLTAECSMTSVLVAGCRYNIITATKQLIFRRHIRQRSRNEPRNLADDDDHNDNGENDCDIVVILLALTYHIHPLPSLRLQLLDQANINIRQGQ